MKGTTALEPGALPLVASDGDGFSIKDFFVRGARDWGISTGKVKLIFGLPFIIMAIGVATALMGKDAYKMFTGEDRISEYLQVACWVVSLGLVVTILKQGAMAGDRLIRTLYVVLALGIVFLIGEEVSWGQRWFGWETPAAYKEINKQDETNLHNIRSVENMFKILHIVIGAYGTILPLLLLRVRKDSPHYQRLSMLIPHYTLIPFFLTTFLWRFFRFVWEPPKRYYFVIAEYAEVMELVLALAFVLFLLFQKRQIEQRRQVLI